MSVTFYYLGGKGSFAQGNGIARRELYRTAIAAEHELAGATRYLKRDGYVVIYYQRPHGEAVRCYGNKYPIGSLRHEYRTAGTEGVGGRACGGGYEQTVGLIGVEIVAIDNGADGDHRRAILLENGYFVECIGPQCVDTIGLDLQQCALLDLIIARENIVQGIAHFVSREVGQETKVTGVDAKDGHTLIAHLCSCVKESTVATYAQCHVGLECITYDGKHGGKVERVVRFEQAQELIFDAHLAMKRSERVEKLLHHIVKTCAILLAEDCYFHGLTKIQ